MKPPAEQQVKVATTTRVGQNNINSNEWLWDSGATQAMTHNITLLHDVCPLKGPTRVKLGDGQYIQAVSRGDLHWCINIDGKTLELFFPNMLYVPKLGQNLLSAHPILKNGYSITGNSHGFSSGVIMIRNLFSLVVLKALCILYLSLSSCHIQWKIGQT